MRLTKAAGWEKPSASSMVWYTFHPAPPTPRNFSPAPLPPLHKYQRSKTPVVPQMPKIRTHLPWWTYGGCLDPESTRPQKGMRAAQRRQWWQVAPAPPNPSVRLHTCAAHLVAAGSPGLSGFPWQLWARTHHTGSRGCLSSECGAGTRAAPGRRPHAHQHPSPGFWRPASPLPGLKTHKGRSPGLAGLWHPNRHSTSVWKTSPSQTCGLAFALKQLLHRLQASPCSGYLCLWFQTIPGYSETHLQAWSFQVRLAHPSSVWLMYGSVLTAIPPPVKQHS